MSESTASRPVSAVIRRRLRTRGFRNLTEDQTSLLEGWMRFNPAVHTLLFALATLAGSTTMMLVLSGLLLIGMLTSVHPFEWFYSAMIRQLEQSPELPPSPPRRRAVFGLGVVFGLAAAWAFEAGRTGLGTALGGLMTVSTAFLTITHICVPSMMFRGAQGAVLRVRRKFRRRAMGQ